MSLRTWTSALVLVAAVLSGTPEARANTCDPCDGNPLLAGALLLYLATPVMVGVDVVLTGHDLRYRPSQASRAYGVAEIALAGPQVLVGTTVFGLAVAIGLDQGFDGETAALTLAAAGFTAWTGWLTWNGVRVFRDERRPRERAIGLAPTRLGDGWGLTAIGSF